MKSLIIIVSLSLSLAGCYQVTSAGDVEDATKICSSYGGINHISVDALGGEFVRCQDEFGKTLHTGTE